MFGPRLRHLRESAGLSQSALASRAGMTPGGVAQLEQGRRQPAWATVQALATALGVSCEAFNESVEPIGDAPGPGRPKISEGTAKPVKPAPKKIAASKKTPATKPAKRKKK